MPDAARDVTCGDPSRFRLTEERDLGTHKVRWSSIDRNGHMNNTCYADLAWDLVPEEWQDATPTDVEIHFSGESRQGDMLVNCLSVEADNVLCVAADNHRGRAFSAKITFSE